MISRSRWVGSDTGGTFTDLVADDGNVVKVPSTPSDPSEAVRNGLTELGFGTSGFPGVLCHGTTVATNAVLERTGGPVALVTTEGFTDVIEIGRQDRPSLYDPTVDRPAPLVERSLRFGVTERLDAHGVPLVAPDPAEVAALGEQLVALVSAGTVAAVAVCLLHADLNPAHEQLVAGVLGDLGLDVTCSHDVSPEFREFERTATTVASAYLRPVCGPYLSGLADTAGEVTVMTSAAGLVDVDAAVAVPARLLLSGPAGGVRAAASVAAANGIGTAVAFDMGGTSTDVCLIVDGVPAPTAERSVDGMPVRLASLDVHTIGAGGGSIAAIDPGGALVVGPRSAGARPGPACYGHGGSEPTVTDANVVLGRIPADTAFSGIGTLDVDAARAALAGAGVTAHGVVQVVNANMEQALRSVTVARGVDPRDVALVAFGGAGGLHCCELADALGITTVVLPERAGVFSAVGVLTAPRQHDVVESWPDPLNHGGIEAAVGRLGAVAVAAVGAHPGDPDLEVVGSVDCRYVGQSHELTVGSVAAFAAEHERRNGYRRASAPIEVVAVRASARLWGPIDPTGLAPRVARQGVVGPAVVAEPDCTIWVPDGWRGDPGAAGALLLTRTRGVGGGS